MFWKERKNNRFRADPVVKLKIQRLSIQILYVQVRQISVADPDQDNRKSGLLKGIVSRDWGGLQMILLHRSYVIISASSFFSFLSAFSYSNFKNGRLSGALFQHSSSKDQ